MKSRVWGPFILLVLLATVVIFLAGLVHLFMVYPSPFASFRGHKNGVNCLAFSPRGSVVASGDGNGAIILWSIRDKRPLLTLKGNSSPVNAIAFAPDGRFLASAFDDGDLTLWDSASGRTISAKSAHKNGILSVLFGPGGRTLFSQAPNERIKVWALPAICERNVRFDCLGDMTPGIVLSPDGQTLVTTTFAHSAPRMWDYGDGRLLRSFSPSEDNCANYCVACDSKWRFIATGTWQCNVVIWDVASGKERLRSGRGWYPVNSVAFSPDGSILAWAEALVRLLNLLQGLGL